MGTVTLLGQSKSDGMLEKIQISNFGIDRTLLELIERHGLFHRCNCREGKCGTCAVKVAVLKRGSSMPGVHLGQLERETLFKAGRLSRHQYASPLLSFDHPLWRLACQYVVEEEEILVAL